MRSDTTRLRGGFKDCLNEIARMKSPDPASLQNLNDIVLPATVSWWPMATGWYVLFGLLLIAFAWFGYRSLRLWMNNRYRRAALRELRLLEDRVHDTAERAANLRQIPVLLKRTALSVYPRNQVASLTGKDWYHFLNSTAKNPPFTESTAGTLDKISYSCGDLRAVDSQATAALLNASRQWLKYHQPEAQPKDVREI
ncbi:MAG: hypothetical protein BMS9Abin30_1329 [Gammaproteobacteria bacterium]|nr:MAG: hypothetical protein BMS9Abin30_1329 [Gammaproteobacteria bacterium]